ncbi:MAG: transposase, partial [Deltaproteobacteria bacterium]
MKHSSVVIKSLSQAYEVIKEMNQDNDQGESDYRTAGRRYLEMILEGRMQERVSASTVSRVAQSLDTAVAAFHRRPIKRQYRFLIFDGVVLKRKTGAGS